LGCGNNTNNCDSTTCCIVKDVDSSLFEVIGESLDINALLDDHVFELGEWCRIEVLIRIQNWVFPVSRVLHAINIEEYDISFLDANDGVVESLTCRSL
jgi:hypothetical protein